ncbi:MAG: DUF2723 domain-containing protein [Anaerolineae bacterium]|nr:DUF2723 domain-containing protein [Anaerolineae bacterium]
MPNLLFLKRISRSQVIIMALAAAALVIAYAVTLQTHINGSSDEYMIDVGEIQVALNVWGTIHHTGYPLFAILGNLFTPPLQLLGVEPALASSLYATAWGLVALGGFGLLIGRLTGRPVLAALCVLLLGLARSIWIHNVIAEVYSMSLAIIVLMLIVVLWPAPWTGAWHVRRRIAWVALLGGIGVAHHRAVAFAAPGLLLALWPHLLADRAHWRRTMITAGGLVLAGFVPYVYLPVRAWQDAEWVYGEPGTWRGFWIEFSGKEADRLVKLPANAAGWWDNIQDVWDILAHELTLPGLLVGLACLALAVIVSPHRRAAWVVGLCAAGPTVFSLAYHTAVLPGAILMITVLALVFGVALVVDWLALHRSRAAAATMLGIVVWAAVLAGFNYDWIHQQVTDPTGLETIARVDRVPRDGRAAFTLPWGPRYSAASYSRLVTKTNADLLMVDHKGDHKGLLADGYRLYTESDTFYYITTDTWRKRLGQLYLTSAAPQIVELRTIPWLADPADPPARPLVYGIARRNAWLTCDDDHVYLHVIWQADQRPAGDPSIFVHLTGDNPAPVLADDDKRHPVYGFYPFTQWSPGELVHDDFTLPRLPGAATVRTGLYEQDTNGQFVNYGELALPIADCLPVDG